MDPMKKFVIIVSCIHAIQRTKYKEAALIVGIHGFSII